jgi:hypothetical protein
VINICVFGNSHTAALVGAWNSIKADFPGFSMTFFAYPNKGLFDTDVYNENVISTSHQVKNAFKVTSNGHESAKVSDYDGILLYGLLDPNQFLYEVDEYVSEQVQARLRTDIVSNELNFHLLRLIRKIDMNKVVHVGLAPYKAHRGESFDDMRILSADSISPVFDELKNEFNYSYVFQPKSTVINGRFTIENYRNGHPNLNIGNEEAFNKSMPDDLKHMNNDYGKIWLDSYLSSYWS